MNQLAELLDAHSDALLQQWVARVDGSASAGGRADPELADHMPAFLRQVIGMLREPSGDQQPSIDFGDSGARRLRPGFELAAVVREYGLLLHAVIDLVERAGAPVSPHEVWRLNEVVTRAEAEATVEHERRVSAAAQTLMADEIERLKAQLETTLLSIGDAVIATDADGMVTLLNPRAEGITGWSASSAIGQPVEDVLPLVDGATGKPLPSPVAELLLGVPSPASDQILFDRRTGQRRAIASSFAAIHDGAGAVVVFRDVTEQKLLEADREQLLAELDLSRRQTESQFNQLSHFFEEAPVAITVFREPGHIVELANPRVCRIWGRAQAQVLGKPFFAAIPEAAGQGLEALLEGVVSSGIPYVGKELLIQLARTEGAGLEDVYFDFVYQPMKNASGEVDRVLIVANDVTDNLRARRAIETAGHAAEALALQLLESEKLLRRVVEASGAGLWDLEAATGDITADAQLLSLMGLPAGASMTLRSALAAIHPEDRDRVARAVAAAFEGVDGGHYLAEFRTVGSGTSTLRWVESRGHVLLGADGKPAHLAGAMLDITPRKEAETVRELLLRELEQRHDFEQHLAGIVSHDLRNPLGAILLGAGTLLQMQDLSEGATKIARRIHSSAQRSARMIRDLLDFTQARLGGGIRLDRRPVDLHAVTSAALDELEAAYPQRAIEMTRSGDARGSWDADRLAQVMTNLVSNAFKYSPAGTLVTVRVSGGADAVELIVHNRGTPIAPERLGQIFEPLVRGSHESDRSSGSLGLGLYIVDSIVRAHGGKVLVDSTAEAGTTFTVRLPKKPVAAVE